MAKRSLTEVGRLDLAASEQSFPILGDDRKEGRDGLWSLDDYQSFNISSQPCGSRGCDNEPAMLNP